MENQVAVRNEIIVEITWDSGGLECPGFEWSRSTLKFLHILRALVEIIAETGNSSLSPQAGLLSNKATAASKVKSAPKYQNSK